MTRRLLDESKLCAIATVSPGARAHVNTAYFAWSPTFDLVWLSAPEARHSRNIRADPSAAVAVYRSTQTWGGSDHGIQLFGRARELRGPTLVWQSAFMRADSRRMTVTSMLTASTGFGHDG